MIYKVLGIIGLILITIGVLIRNREIQDIYFIIGGIFLTTYSFHIGDPIFITLQIVFIIASIYGLLKNKSFKARKNSK